MIYSVYKDIFKHTSLSFIFFSVSNTSSWPSLYTSDFLWSILFIYLSFVRLSYRFIFFGYLCTYLWWLNLYTYLLLVTHSVQLDYFEGLILYTYFPMFDLFSFSTTSSWPSLYSSDFMAYFVNLPHLGKFTYTCGILRRTPLVTYSVNISHLCETSDSVHMGVLDDIFLYTYLPMLM